MITVMTDICHSDTPYVLSPPPEKNNHKEFLKSLRHLHFTAITGLIL